MHKYTHFFPILFPLLATFFSPPPSTAQQNFSFATQYTLANADDSTHLGTYIAVPAPDGGYYLGGLVGRYVTDAFHDYYHYILLKLNCQGSIEWIRLLDSTYFHYNRGGFLSLHLKTLNNNILFFRSFRHPGVVAFDANGDVLYQKELHFNSPDSTAFISDIKPLPNGNWVIMGETISILDTPENFHRFYMMTDAAFNLLWSFMVHSNVISNANKTFSSSILHDSQYLYFVDASFKNSFFIVKTDYNGNIIFYKDYIFHPNPIYIKINQPALLINNSIYTTALHRQDQYNITNLILVRINPSDGQIENAKYLQLLPKKNLDQSFRNPIRLEYLDGMLIIQTTVFYEGYNLPFRAIVDTNFNLIKVERWTLPNDYAFFHANPLGFLPHLHDHNTYSSLQRNFFPFSFRRGGLFVSKRPLNDLHCFHYNDVTHQYRISEPPTTNVVRDHLPLIIQPGPRIRNYRDTAYPIPIHTSTVCLFKGFNALFHPNTPNSFCINDSVLILPHPSLQHHSIQWFLNDSFFSSKHSFSFLPSDTGTHSLFFIASDGCFSDTSHTLTFQISAPDTAHHFASLCPGDTLHIFNLSISQPGTYLSSIPGYPCDSPLILQVDTLPSYRTSVDTSYCTGQTLSIHGIPVSSDTTITISLSASNGCDSTVSYRVSHNPDCNNCPISLPLAFSPNGDQLNDHLRPINPCNLPLSSFQLRIYNRWGQLVFHSNNPNQPWNGYHHSKPAPQGVYLAILSVTLPNGNTRIIRQDITLIR